MGIDFERHPRPLGEYYREPYPITLQVISPEIPGLPSVRYPLTDTMKNDLLSYLQLELKK